MDEGILSINSILSSSRPFQEAKEQCKILCAECFQRRNEIKFFLKGAGQRILFRYASGSIQRTVFYLVL